LIHYLADGVNYGVRLVDLDVVPGSFYDLPVAVAAPDVGRERVARRFSVTAHLRVTLQNCSFSASWMERGPPA
jgi:hypothetical protein